MLAASYPLPACLFDRPRSAAQAGSAGGMRTVAEALSRAVVVERSVTLQEASARMLDAAGEVALVVDDDGTFMGIVTAQDVAHALAEGHDARVARAEEIADREPPVARPDEPLVDAHRRMRIEQRELAVAVDREGKPLGLLTDS